MKEKLNLLDFILNFTYVVEMITGILLIIIVLLRNKVIVELLYIDPLTNKGNRIAFEEYLNKYGDKIKGIAFLDANDLKKINDTFGHTAGDELLISISECIQTAFSGFGKLYRVSGDEFVVLLNKDIDEQDLLYKLKKEYDKMSEKIGYKVSVSCGLAIQNMDSHISKEKLYFIAEQNMYQAKAQYYKENGHDRRSHQSL